jgi:hypothetical protein
MASQKYGAHFAKVAEPILEVRMKIGFKGTPHHAGCPFLLTLLEAMGLTNFLKFIKNLFR